MEQISFLEHALQARYLDCPTDRASLVVLRESGVLAATASSTALPNTAGSLVEVDSDSALQQEHCSVSDVVYAVTKGRVLLDVRDSADCWVRCCLSEGMEVTLKAKTLRRFVVDASCATVQVREACNQPRQLSPRFTRSADEGALLARTEPQACRELVCELCRLYYAAEWMTGTGGAMSLRHGERIYVTPSGVAKERLQPEDLYVLDVEGGLLSRPTRSASGTKSPKLSDCAPLFLHAHKLRQAAVVIHSHGLTCNLAAELCDGQSEFRISHQEMIKGLTGHGYADTLVVPVLDNAPKESALAEPLAEALAAYPKTSAVLVRRHGLFVWGESWEAAKRHAECLHYLFTAAIEMRKLQLDYAVAPSAANGERSGPKLKRARVAEDIEGTTTPISVVNDALEKEKEDYVPNPSFKTSTGSHKEKDKNPPKRALSAYMFFSNDIRETVKREMPELEFLQISMEIGKRWKQITDEDRRPYDELAAADKRRYQEEKEEYLSGLFDTDGSPEERDPNAPHRPLSGYFFFCCELRSEVYEANPGKKLTEIAALLAERWRELPDKKRVKYQKMHEEAMAKYQQEMDAYNHRDDERQAPSLAESHQVVLLDIEGTTTPISFVHDVLFPFVVERVEQFLRDTWTLEDTQRDVKALQSQHAEDVASGLQPPLLAEADEQKALARYVQWNVAKDRKVGALKQLQGRMWRLGYESGELKAQVYADVPPCLARLQTGGTRVAIYSSGSRQAQKLLFQFSDKGDLRRYLIVYFDTKVGHKREVSSYREIVQSLGVDSGSDVLFVTDVLEEAQAAKEAGLDAVLSLRPGNKPLPEAHGFPTIRSFAEL